jgi:hypothetical protein
MMLAPLHTAAVMMDKSTNIFIYSFFPLKYYRLSLRRCFRVSIRSENPCLPDPTMVITHKGRSLSRERPCELIRF